MSELGNWSSPEFVVCNDGTFEAGGTGDEVSDAVPGAVLVAGHWLSIVPRGCVGGGGSDGGIRCPRSEEGGGGICSLVEG